MPCADQEGQGGTNLGLDPRGETSNAEKMLQKSVEPILMISLVNHLPSRNIFNSLQGC